MYFTGLSLWVAGIGLLAPAIFDFTKNALSNGLKFLPISIVCWYCGFRCLRFGVVVTSQGITVHNFFLTRTANVTQIAAIDLEAHDSGEAGLHWVPRVKRNNGSRFWVSGLDFGRAEIAPSPDGLALLEEIRNVLGTSGETRQPIQKRRRHHNKVEP
jgi:hypothetical protein